MLRLPDLASDARFCNNRVRTANRVDLEAKIQAVFSQLSYAEAVDRLTEAQTAYGAINSVVDLIRHPQLRTRAMPVNGQTVQVPAVPYITDWDDEAYPAAPRIGEHRDLPGQAGPTKLDSEGA